MCTTMALEGSLVSVVAVVTTQPAACVGAQISQKVGVLPENVIFTVQFGTSMVACAR